MLQSKKLVKIAAGLLLFHLLGHLIGHYTWKEDKGNLQKREVIRQMTEPRFDFMGASRSMGEYYEGYSTLLSITFIVLAWVLWQTSGLLEEKHKAGKQLALFIGIGLLLFSITEFVYFFPFAAIISLLAGGFSLLALKTKV